MFHEIVDTLTGEHHEKTSKTSTKIKASVVLVKSNVVGFNDFVDSFLDGLHELVGSGISFELISATIGDPSERGNRGKVGNPAYLEKWITTETSLAAGDASFPVTFDWDEQLGTPGAVIVKNHHHGEFYLKSLTLDGVPGPRSRIHFSCNSWVYPVSTYNYDRVFFANDVNVPTGTMPKPLKPYRVAELLYLRGDNITRQLKEGDRVYAYDYYNDLGDPDKGSDYVRPILGGSKEYPYPRRAGLAARHPRRWVLSAHFLSLSLSLSLAIKTWMYVPRDERFGHLKMSDFLAYALKSLVQALAPVLEAAADQTPFEFDTFEDVLKLYEGGIDLPDCPAFEDVRNQIPFQLIKELIRTDGEHLLRLPTPDVIKAYKFAWRTDEEFGREMLAGVNPVIIRISPVSNIDPSIYGNQNSTMTADQIEKNMNGLTVDEVRIEELSACEPSKWSGSPSRLLSLRMPILQALKKKKLFILNHHDALMPYLERINSTNNRIYATRTVLLLQDDGTLKPLAIELSLPIQGKKGAVSKVYTPADHGVEGTLWQLAKAYAAVNDSGVHQLISHWLNTHATMEPFVIATNRQLSVVHPIYKLLSPHFRDTMNINALARQILINAGGSSRRRSSPTSTPWSCLRGGVAVEDPASPGRLRLLIEDYPYAVDGLAVWSAIEEWVEAYCTIYYPSDKTVQEDTELQAWWREVREVGHGDKKDEPWWPAMRTVAELNRTCSTIIWVASALHAAVNFGQYPYSGYLPNRPTISRRFMPEPGTPEYTDLEANPDRVFLKTITNQLQSILGISLIEILSRHSSDEVYLGQRDTPEWTSDEKALTAFEAFADKLSRLKNRNGPVKLPYTLLYPSTSNFNRVGGLTGRGIPNSVSI
ncbi:unnamed protein product [Spirodela intermedia]|uniref:Lipoxygenase n=1 Tax=Spirodela intermedia TaxID=51605 RepID=A0A7I8INS2_SPIIN|nr:unnamed protein product [Spirodela intermedia]CAA6659113.1 unnamed protein product [Spirodela intermedia]